MMNRYKMEQMLRGIGQEIKEAQNKLDEMYTNSDTTVEARNKQKEVVKDLQDRAKGIQERIDTEDSKAELGKDNIVDEKDRVVNAKATFIRNVMRNESISGEVKAALGDNNGTGGEKLIPTTLANELLHEPFETDPLRNISTFTSTTNLEIPKITFTLDDDSFIKDGETAKEIKVSPDQISFTRNKFKVFVPISETILASTNTDLNAQVQNALQSGLARKEKNVVFATSPKTGEEHMSFYKADIKEVTGKDMYTSILSAFADLEDEYAENASVVMNKADYFNMIQTLANGNTSLYSAQPKQILGFDVIFCANATTPIIGDFRYSHFNYEPQMIYDRDKDVKTGMDLFVLTAWFDHRITMKSAFRLAKVTPSTK